MLKGDIMNLVSLESFIDLICTNNGMHICINDLTAFFSHPLLSLSDRYIYHHETFCDFVKDGLGCLKECVEYKNSIITRLCEGEDCVEEECPFGMHQFSYPIIVENKIRGVLFIFNISGECTEKKLCDAVRKKGKKNSVCSELLSGLEPCLDRDKYKNAAMLIENHIVGIYNEIKTESGNYSKNKWVVEQMIRDAQKYYFTDIDIKTEAKRYFYNVKYLGRLFKKEVKKPFGVFLSEIRLEHAKKELSETKNTVISISEHCGFGSVTHFNRAFKEFTGCSPSDYRKLY